MVDAADLKSAGCKTVGVQVPLPPSLKTPAAAGFWQGSDGRGGSGVRHDLGTKPQNGQARHGFRHGCDAPQGPVSELRQSGSQAALSGDSEQSAASCFLCCLTRHPKPPVWTFPRPGPVGLMSRMSFLELAIVSLKKALVLGRTAARQEAGSSGLSTKDTVMPSLGSV